MQLVQWPGFSLCAFNHCPVLRVTSCLGFPGPEVCPRVNTGLWVKTGSILGQLVIPAGMLLEVLLEMEDVIDGDGSPLLTSFLHLLFVGFLNSINEIFRGRVGG